MTATSTTKDLPPPPAAGDEEREMGSWTIDDLEDRWAQLTVNRGKVSAADAKVVFDLVLQELLFHMDRAATAERVQAAERARADLFEGQREELAERVRELSADVGLDDDAAKIAAMRELRAKQAQIDEAWDRLSRHADDLDQYRDSLEGEAQKLKAEADAECVALIERAKREAELILAGTLDPASLPPAASLPELRRRCELVAGLYQKVQSELRDVRDRAQVELDGLADLVQFGAVDES